MVSRARPVVAGATCIGCLIFATAALWSSQPDSEALQNGFREAYRAADWDLATELGEALERAQPGQWRTRYTIACAHARAGRLDHAFSWLARAVESGFYRRRLIREDDDLASVRGDPRFASVVRAVDLNWEHYQTWLEARCEENPPLVVEPRDHDPHRPAGVLVALHGHGGRPDGYPEEWRRVTRKAGLLLVCPASQHAFGAGFSWAGTEEAELVVDLALQRLARSHVLDHDRIVLTGFSQGGWIAFALGAGAPARFTGVIPMACGFEAGTDQPPVAGERAPPFYFMVGSHDRAMDGTREAAAAFDAAGYRTELRVYRSTGHTFPVALVPELERALRFVLPDLG